jgi:phosphate transport system substrate-binding protein
MASQVGICTNVGNCTLADRGERISIPIGGLFLCPECQRELSPVGGGTATAGPRPRVLVLAMVALLLLAGLGGAFWFLFQKRAPAESATAPSVPPPGAPASPAAPAGNGEVVLRLQGSNTIGESLAPALAEKFLTSQGARDVRRESMGTDETRVVGTLEGGPKAIEIRAHGTGTAFEALASNGADIGMASRPIRPDEKSRLAALGDLTSRASEHVLGLDGLAVIVHPANPVDALSLDQVRDLFTGRISDGSRVGGTAGPVQLYARDDNSGTFETFREIALRGQGLAAGARRFENSKELAQGVAGDPRGIGFIGLAFVGGAKAVRISADAGSMAMRPTVLTVRTEDYPLSRRLYLYTAAAPSNPWTKRFVDFALSDPGQAVVEASGFVGQALARQTLAAATEAPAPRTGLPPAYARFTQGAERLPFNFRFRTGSDELDTKAYRDLGRLVQLMTDPDYQSRQVLLFGFADAQGADAANLTLSRNRAQAVRAALESEGIRPTVVEGFGEELPVAENDTPEGREKNRRVEIWLRR